MRRVPRAGHSSRRSSAPIPPFAPDDAASVLPRFERLHKQILEVLAQAERQDVVVTCGQLAAAMVADGVPTSEYEVRSKVNELKVLGMVRSLPDDVLERDSPVPVLGVIS